MKIGIIGGGQLARMMALAGYPLGLEFCVLDPSPTACAGQLADHIVGEYDDEASLNRLIEWSDLVTYDFENIPVSAARYLESKVTVYPPVDALAASQDRLVEKRMFAGLGIPTPTFYSIDSLDELKHRAQELDFSCILKTRRLGYDGKGQHRIERDADIDDAWNALSGHPLILEKKLSFKRELSIIAVRDRNGVEKFYPLAENKHSNGVLTTSFAPAIVEDALLSTAIGYSSQLMRRLNYCGVFSLELFDMGDQLFVNEMAPRVHNSGHWSIEGAKTSQFENHLRAICGWPLGAVDALGYTAMLNWIGNIPPPTTVFKGEGGHLHNYGKEFRVGRKVGHFTVCAESFVQLQSQLSKFSALIKESPSSSS